MGPNFCLTCACLLAGSTFAAAVHGADYPWGSEQSGEAPVARVESPYLTRQLADAGHLMPLYEAWMAETFCGQSRNRKNPGRMREPCSRRSMRKLIGTCSARLRGRMPKAYLTDLPNRDRHPKFIRAYKNCLKDASRKFTGTRKRR